MIKIYSELLLFETFEDRFNYLKLDGKVGVSTFGYDRYLNQFLYHSDDWKQIRDIVIIRDCGCDLAIPDREIHGRIIVHHMNPITEDDILNRSSIILDPEFLITTSIDTHNAIHYGSFDRLYVPEQERSRNDTSPWLL